MQKGLIRASRPSGCVDFGLILRYALSEYRRGYSIIHVPCLSLKIDSNSAHVDLGNSPSNEAEEGKQIAENKEDGRYIHQ